jgi:hypothetical protein
MCPDAATVLDQHPHKGWTTQSTGDYGGRGSLERRRGGRYTGLGTLPLSTKTYNFGLNSLKYFHYLYYRFLIYCDKGDIYVFTMMEL